MIEPIQTREETAHLEDKAAFKTGRAYESRPFESLRTGLNVLPVAASSSRSVSLATVATPLGLRCFGRPNARSRRAQTCRSRGLFESRRQTLSRSGAQRREPVGVGGPARRPAWWVPLSAAARARPSVACWHILVSEHLEAARAFWGDRAGRGRDPRPQPASTHRSSVTRLRHLHREPTLPLGDRATGPGVRSCDGDHEVQ
jgi:hypothetical protein